jgi:predicted helicase
MMKFTNEYKKEIEKYHKKIYEKTEILNSNNESNLKKYFSNLIEFYVDKSKKNLFFTDEKKQDKTNIPDGAILNHLNLVVGYWEAKDTKDNLDREIEKKLEKGYLSKNIIFENSERAVLFQNGKAVQEISMKDNLRLHEILNNFINYEAPEITSFEKALKQFSKDVPNVIDAIRKKINTTSSKDFKKEFRTFLEEIQKTIHDSITENDIIEMLIQHILTEDIFNKVFEDFDYHKNNAVSKSLQRLEFLLLGNDGNRELFLKPINYYYEALENLLLEIPTDVEKQNFLVKIYEEFYKAYNPKKADTLGIIYTPVELVDFMIRVTDSILEKHFDLKLESENVAILDPATGTGNFVT